MIMTTTNGIEGMKVRAYHGIVFGEVVSGVNFLKDMMAGIRDIVGGRSGNYEAELIKARDQALAEMEKRARELGGNAVIGVDVDYEVLGQNGSMMMVSASGTAVSVE
jgi:uncharacterized protein YbjQ (UPF0145 family)